MGCFLACFGSSKRRKPRHKVLPRHHRNASSKTEQPSIQDYSITLLTPTSELQGCKPEAEEQLSVSTRKKVTFDSNVKTYEPILQDEVVDLPPENNKEGRKEETLAKSSQNKSSSSEDGSVTSTGSYRSNHRYQNCRYSDDEEDEELDYGISDLSDNDEDDDCDMREEYNQLVDKEAVSPIPKGDGDVNSIGSNPNARDRSVYVHPVLNPVENLTQWKVVKAKRTTPPFRPQKENNCILNEESRDAFGAAEPSSKEPSFSLKSEGVRDPSKKFNQEIAVDASLSNWLISPETTLLNKEKFSGTPDRSTSQGSNSVISHEDRPILGALTVEELRQFSASNSPRKSPSRSPDEMPIIGTVGTYWNVMGSAEDSGSTFSATSSFKGIPNTTSKYREDKRVNWHSTPFETRLERALNRGAAEAASTCVHRVF